MQYVNLYTVKMCAPHVLPLIVYSFNNNVAVKHLHNYNSNISCLVPKRLTNWFAQLEFPVTMRLLY